MVKQGTIEVYLSSDDSDNPQRCVITLVKYKQESNKWISVEDWEKEKKKSARKTQTAAKDETK